MKNGHLLEINNLNSGYGAIQVLWDINLQLKSKEIVCIIGANGAGKSTLLKNIVGMVIPFKGEIKYSNQDITNLPAPERIKRGIGFAPKDDISFWFDSGR